MVAIRIKVGSRAVGRHSITRVSNVLRDLDRQIRLAVLARTVAVTGRVINNNGTAIGCAANRALGLGCNSRIVFKEDILQGDRVAFNQQSTAHGAVLNLAGILFIPDIPLRNSLVTDVATSRLLQNLRIGINRTAGTGRSTGFVVREVAAAQIKRAGAVIKEDRTAIARSLSNKINCCLNQSFRSISDNDATVELGTVLDNEARSFDKVRSNIRFLSCHPLNQNISARLRFLSQRHTVTASGLTVFCLNLNGRLPRSIDRPRVGKSTFFTSH